MNFKMLIPADKVEQTRKFFRERGGVLLWKNQEIGVQRDDVMAPVLDDQGKDWGKPHWAYGNPERLEVADIGVRTETIIEPPKEWFPKCTCCPGDGRRPVASVAVARGCSVVEAEVSLCGNGVQIADGTFECNYCQGTGHIERRFRTRLKKFHYGLSPINDNKADRVVARLEKHFGITGVKHRWEYDGSGLGRLDFYTETIIPFTMEESNAEAHRSGG